MAEINMDLKQLETKLSHMAYESINQELQSLSTSVLLQLFDARSVKVGDSAASLLFRNELSNEVVDAVLSGQLRTKTGKIRATNILLWRGKECPRAVEVYQLLIHDQNPEVATNALFGLVFLQDQKYIPEIKQALLRFPKDSKECVRFALGVEALEKEDPFLYSPNFRDPKNIWKLDPERFGHRIGKIP